MKENTEADNRTQQWVTQIDQYIDGLGYLKDEEEKVMTKVQKLKKMASCQQEKVNQIV